MIIDLPQVVSAAGNNTARDMFLRDVHNIRNSLARFAPELQATHFGEEIWALYQQGKLKPDSVLQGLFEFDETAADVDNVLLTIEDARQEASLRQQRREENLGPELTPGFYKYYCNRSLY